MIGLQSHRLTTDDYHRMGEAGILNPDTRMELLDGEIIPMLPIGPFHTGAVRRLTERFCELSRRRWTVSVQCPLLLDDHSEPEPDLALLRRHSDLYGKRTPHAADAYLVVQVADSSLDFDREIKLPLYARIGIPEVWIVNVPDKLIEVFREPNGGLYTQCERILPGDPLAPAAFPDAGIDTAELLSPNFGGD